MAASTESQASSWPPRNQGSAPSGDCSAAMATTVCRSWSAVSTPGTSGRSSGTRQGSGRVIHGGLAGRDGGLVGVDDEALADQRVQQALEGAGQPGPAGEVPDEQPVVGADDGGVPVDPDGALEPPKGSVQRVRVMGVGGLQPDRGEPLPQLVAAVDPDVPALV